MEILVIVSLIVVGLFILVSIAWWQMKACQHMEVVVGELFEVSTRLDESELRLRELAVDVSRMSSNIGVMRHNLGSGVAEPALRQQAYE